MQNGYEQAITRKQTVYHAMSFCPRDDASRVVLDIILKCFRIPIFESSLLFSSLSGRYFNSFRRYRHALFITLLDFSSSLIYALLYGDDCFFVVL